MAERAELGHQLVLYDVQGPAARQPRDQRLLRPAAGRHERLGRKDALGQRLLDDVLALGQEQPDREPVALGLQLAGSLQPRVRARGDRLHADVRQAAAASAAFAVSASTAKALGSLTAMSASTLRSSSTSASFRPCIIWLYDIPFWRAPALMRMIHSRRKSRLRTRRSR